MKKRIKTSALMIMILLAGSGVFAQHIQTQYFLNIPQSTHMNPAFRPDANVYIGMPGFSGAYLGVSNNLLNLTRLVQPVPGSDSLMTVLHPDYDRDRFFRSIGQKGFVSTEISVPIINVGVNLADEWWLDIGIAFRGMARAKMPADLFTLALEGNEEFVGTTADLSGMGMNAQAFVETHVGLSRDIGERLRVGGRLKLMQGAMSASLVADELGVYVDEDYSHAFNTSVSLKLNGPFDVTLDEDGFIDDILFRENPDFNEVGPSFKNFGLGLDLGAEYTLLDNLKLSASLIDLGFMRWGREAYTFNASNQFTFDGIDITEALTEDRDFDLIVDEFADSLFHTFDFIESDEPYTTGLPAKLYLAASYQPLDFLSLGLLSRTTIGMGVRESLTLSATLFAGDVLSSSLSYTMTNRSFNNFGFGLGVRGGPAQFYVVLDQIPASWVEFTGDNGNDRVLLPQRFDYLNVRFGFNLMFGRAEVKMIDKPMLSQ